MGSIIGKLEVSHSYQVSFSPPVLVGLWNYSGFDTIDISLLPNTGWCKYCHHSHLWCPNTGSCQPRPHQGSPPRLVRSLPGRRFSLPTLCDDDVYVVVVVDFDNVREIFARHALFPPCVIINDQALFFWGLPQRWEGLSSNQKCDGVVVLPRWAKTFFVTKSSTRWEEPKNN